MDASEGTCSSAGPGTEAQPYCTITQAVTSHSGPGVTIVVEPGTYPEQVTIPGSGTISSPFVIQAVSANVVVDGADSFADPGQWSLASGNTWLASGVSWRPGQVFADGARLDSVATAPAQLPPSSFVWVTGEGLYVNLGGDNPGNHQTLVGHRSYGFNLSGKSWVTVDGFTIAHPEVRGVYLQSACANVTISDNRESFSGGHGMEAVGGSGIQLVDNVTANNVGHGIALISGATGCTLSGNESYGNSDPATRVSNGIYLFGSPANTLSGNRLHDNQDTGMHMQSGSNDCVAYNNISWHNGDHGFDNLMATGITHVCDVAFGNHMDGFSIEGSASGVHLTDCIAVDNGLTTNRFDLWVDNNSVPGFVSDYNIFWNSNGQAPFKYITTIYPTLAGYQAASGEDAHTLQADPRFIDGPSGNFHLLPGSPAIDSGDSGVPNWPAQDAEGNGRLDLPDVPNSGVGPISYADRGALERYSMAVDVPAQTPYAGGLRLTPNPMKGKGTLRFGLERPGHLHVQLLDLVGRVVRHVADRDVPAGSVELDLSGEGDDGRPLQAGVYFVRVKALGRTLQERCVILR